MIHRQTLFSRTTGALLATTLPFLGLVGLAVAQLGGGYVLFWSTIDGEGAHLEYWEHLGARKLHFSAGMESVLHALCYRC